MLHRELTGFVIGQAYQVHNILGHGFLESIYEGSLFKRLTDAGLKVERQKKIKVFFEGVLVGFFYADLVVNDILILELKAVRDFDPRYSAQLINYLKACNIEIGLLINFGMSVSVKRCTASNQKEEYFETLSNEVLEALKNPIDTTYMNP